MAPRKSAPRTQTKKAAAKKSPARILMPSGATDEGEKKPATTRKRPARRGTSR